ncbi:hypothetical protein R3P38DRAFT_2649411 [Favolaschia claudopus]|uniref:F-box domain-containing protein n=1 Tax=Favolaschia claudopus TaxID=2862362 RepID=A0AAW0A5I4_9AGAR
MEPPFSHRLGTNYVPTDEEIDQIKFDLLSRTAELAQIDERIRELSEQRDKLWAYIEPRKALISHPRRLPMDILEAIFLQCLPSTRNAVMSAQEAPLLVCRICSAWRTAALSMPRLWASLHIPTAFIIAKSETRIAAVEQWLIRAAASSLSISVYRDLARVWGWATPPHSDYNVMMGALLKILVRSFPQWQKIVLNIDAKTAEALADIEPPYLRSFTFTGDLSILSLFNSNLLNGQHLRAVSLCSDSDLNPVPNFPVAWHQLTHLKVQSSQTQTLYGGRALSLSNMIPLLGRCPQLVSLYVTLDSEEEPLFDHESSVALLFLESFTATLCGAESSYSHLAYIVASVSMPKLRRLHFTVETQCSEQDSFALASIGAKHPFVQDLAIHLYTLHARALSETFRAFPALTNIQIRASRRLKDDGWDTHVKPCGTAPLLELLTDNIVCPRLQELEVTGIIYLSKPTLDAFLASRLQMDSARRLRRLSLVFEDVQLNDSEIPYLSLGETQFYASQSLHISFFPVTVSREKRRYAPWPWTGLLP